MFCLPAETRHPLSSPGAWCCPDNWPTCAPSRSRSRSLSLSLFHPLLFTIEQDLLFPAIANSQAMSLRVWFIHILDKCLPLSHSLSLSTALSVYHSFFLRLLYLACRRHFPGCDISQIRICMRTNTFVSVH